MIICAWSMSADGCSATLRAWIAAAGRTRRGWRVRRDGAPWCRTCGRCWMGCARMRRSGALGRWLDVDGGDAAALDRLIAALDEVDRED